MSSDPPSAAPSALEALRSMGATLVALVQDRIELAVVELREEGERRKEMMVLAAAAGVFLTLAAGLLGLFVVLLFWDTHRLAAAAAMTAIYAAIGVFALVRLKRAARESPKPFEATLAELGKDVDALRGGP